MNRTEGLVQRRNVIKENSDGTLKENHDVDDKKNDKNYDDGDSKETRLTLMEEVLLLGLKDKEVSILVHDELRFPSFNLQCYNFVYASGLHIVLE